MCSGSVNEFNVQLLEWGVHFSGHVQWLVAAVSITAEWATENLQLCSRLTELSHRGILVRDERFIQSAHSPPLHAAQPFSFPEMLFSLKTCLKGFFNINELFMESIQRKFESLDSVCFGSLNLRIRRGTIWPVKQMLLTLVCGTKVQIIKNNLNLWGKQLQR